MLWTLWRRTIIAITAIGAVVASFIFLTDLAVHAGWPEQAAWLLPLCIDALAAMALTQYRFTGRKGPGIVAVGAILLSALGNAASHWFTSGLLEPGWLAITTVGIIPAIALGLCIHLSIPKEEEKSSTLKDTQESAGALAIGTGSLPAASGKDTTTQNRRKTSRHSGTAHTASATGIGITKKTDADYLKLIRENHWTGESATKLTKLLPIGKSRALRLRKQLQEAESEDLPEKVGADTG